MRGWRKVTNTERHKCLVVNSNRLKRMGHVIHTGHMRNTNKNFVRKPAGKMSYERGVFIGE
jgi:hypothetical protein